MLHGFLNFLIFLIVAGVSSWIYKLIVSLLAMISMFGVFGVLTGFKGNMLEDGFEKYPKRLVFTLVGNAVIIGTLNAIMIFTTTALFLQRTESNFWIYVALSVIWSLLILAHVERFLAIYFATSTLTLILFWLGFGSLSFIIVAPLTFFISLAYYMGRADVIAEEQKSM